MMRFIKIALLLLFSVAGASAQVAVSGDLKTLLAGTATTSNSFIRFCLINYQPNAPLVSGVGLLMDAGFCEDMKPNGSGVLSGSIYGNDVITPAGTQYRVERWFQGRFISAAIYNITGGTFNLNTAVPVASAPAATSSTVVMASVTCQFPAASTTWVCVHNLASNDILYAAYDSSGVGILGSTPTKTDSNTLTLSFLVAQAGSLTVVKVGNFALTPGSLTLSDVVVKVPGAGQTILGNYQFNVDGHYRWKSGTGFYGILSHANTADRTYTFPNLTGEAALFTSGTTSLAAFSHANSVLRTYTFPDVSFTVPAPSLAQTWTAAQTFDTVIIGKQNNILFVDGVKYATIAAALTAASDGDVIFIPRGNYSVALDALSVSKSVRFVGAGVNSTVITFTGASGIAFKFIYDDNAPTGSYTDWGAGIENCQIIGPGTINGGAGNAGTGIQLGDATHSSIGAYFRNVIIAGFDIGTTWSQGGPQAIASWGTKFDHVTWLNNDQQVLFNYSSTGTGLAHIEFIHPTFNHYQAGVTVQANAVQFAGTIGGEFNLINPYFQSDQLVVSNNRVKLINPTFENTNGQSTATYVSHTGGDLEMINPHFLQTSTGATVPTAYVTSSAGHLGMVNPGGNNSSATTFPAIALSGSVNVDIYGFRAFTNSSALFSGSTSGYLNSPNPSTGRQQFGGNDLVDINSTQTMQGKTFSDTVNLKRLRASQGTALVAGDFALSAGWGTTASVGTVSGTDQFFEFVVTSAGTGQGASPTITHTPKDGTWTTAPIWNCIRKDYGSQATVTFTHTTQTATSLVLTFNGTPVAAETFKIGCHTGGI